MGYALSSRLEGSHYWRCIQPGPVLLIFLGHPLRSAYAQSIDPLPGRYVGSQRCDGGGTGGQVRVSEELRMPKSPMPR